MPPDDIMELYYRLGEIESATETSGDIEEGLRQIDRILADRPEGARLIVTRWMRGRLLVRHRGLLAGAADYGEALEHASKRTGVAIRYELGTAWKELGDSAEAISLLERTASDATELEDWGVVARAKEHLSGLLETLGRIEDARALAVAADEAWAKTDEVEERARGLRRFGELEWRQEDWQRAEGLLRGARELYLEAGHTASAIEVRTQVADTLRKQGNTDDAIAEARGSVEEAGATDPALLALTSYVLGLALDAAPNHKEEAEQTLERASREASRLGNSLLDAQASGDLAILLASQERFEEALSWNDRSNAMYLAVGDLRGSLICWRNAAKFYEDLGQTDDRVSALRRALELAQRMTDINASLELRSEIAKALETPETMIELLLTGLEAAHRGILAESESAEDFDRKSAELFTGFLDGASNMSLGESLDFVAKIIRSAPIDQLRVCISLSRGALIRWASHPGRELPVLLYEHGSLLLRLGDFEGAVVYLVRASDRAADLGEMDLKIACANNLSIAYRKLGLVEDAQRAISSTLPDVTDPATADGLKLNLAVTYMRTWDFTSAEPILKSVFESAKERGDTRLTAVAASNLASVLADTDRAEQALGYLDVTDDEAPDAIPLHELMEFFRIKGHVLETAGRTDDAVRAYERMAQLTETARGSLITPYMQLRFMAARQHYYADPVRLIAPTDPGKALYFAEVGRARSMADSMHAPNQPGHSVPTDLCSRVQAKLSRDEAVVAYYVANDQLFIWGIAHDRLTWTAVDVKADDLLAAVTGYRESLDRSSESRVFRDELTDWLVEPVRDFIGAFRTVHFSPHGPLHLVPFHALGKGSRLVEDFNVSCLPALHLLDQKPTWDQSWMTAPLVIADPDGTLPGAAEEAARISRVLPQSTLLVGQDATKAAVLSRVKGASLVHIASHAFFDHREPLDSGVRLVDHAGGLDTLTVFEIIQSWRSRAKLIVLSGCETRIVALSAADDVVGLPTAFLFAGAETIIASMWRVPDEDTADLMEALYLSMLTLPPIEALSDAQRKIASDPRADVSSWAAFTVYTIASSRRTRLTRASQQRYDPFGLGKAALGNSYSGT